MMEIINYIPLRVHTEYGDGSSGYEEYIGRVLELGIGGIGIVDKNLNNVNRQPCVVVDDSGYVHVSWARGNSGNNQDPHPDIGYNFSKDRGVNFLNKDIFVVDNPGLETYRGNPSITVNRRSGEIYVLWEDARGFPDEEPHLFIFLKIYKLIFLQEKAIIDPYFL